MSLRTYTDAVVVMTGGASGIGRTMAQELIARGAHVVLADRNEALLQATASELGAEPFVCDVTDEQQVQALIDHAFTAHGRLDYLFNNAGIIITGSTRTTNLEQWKRVLDVNINGVVYGVQLAYPRMVEQGFGHIVNTASAAGLLPTPGALSYGTSKHAVVGLSTSLRLEAQRKGVRVTALCPGFIRTPILTGGEYGSVDKPQNPSGSRFKRPMEPDAFAREAIHRLARNPAMIILPRQWQLAYWLFRLSPELMWRVMG